jgi:hypothetical protein
VRERLAIRFAAQSFPNFLGCENVAGYGFCLLTVQEMKVVRYLSSK